MSRASSIALGNIMATKSGSVDPSKFTDEIFDLYSIPAFDRGEPEIVAGSAIGSAKQVVEPGDVLLSKIVPHIRRSWIVGKERGRRIIASGEWIVFRSECANPDYLRQVLVGDPFHTQFMNTVAGVGGSLLRARPAHVAKIAIPLPPLAEQRRIAAVLDRAEALRAKRRAALAQLDSLTQSLFLDLFGNPVGNPNKWRMCAVGEIADCIVPGRDKPKSFTGNVPWITTDDLQHLEVTSSSPKKLGLSAAEIAEVRARVIPEGSVIISCVGDLGIVSLAGTDLVINQQLHSFQCHENVNNVFMMHCLAFQEAFMYAKASSTTLPYMNKTVCNSIPVVVPPIPLQREFARRVTAVEALKTAQRASLAELDALFATLQHRAFRGEL